MAAEYLLRFDDLCPTMNGKRWLPFRELIERYELKPILAVVPENCDVELAIDPADEEFWGEMRRMQRKGAAIGLHGYRHRCVADGRSLVPLYRRTEFAGVALETQREWIRLGIEILRREGLEPRIWVAPRHGFDLSTLTAIASRGLEVVSDGFATRPYRSYGFNWIPQQLWRPVAKAQGLWTICIHANTASEQQIDELALFLDRYSAQFTSVDRVLVEWPLLERTLGDRWFQAQYVARMRLRSALARDDRTGITGREDQLQREGRGLAPRSLK